MSNFRLKKITLSLFFPFLLSSCAPLIPENYLGPTNIRTPQNINGTWISPRLIPISAKMLNTPEGRELLEPAMRPQLYQIGPFDNLNIIIWGHPEISTVATSAIPTAQGTGTTALNGLSGIVAGSTSNPAVLVETDGTIFYPYVGRLYIAGDTVYETQRKFAARLSKYIRNPQVSVQVAKFRNRNAYVLGEVRSPGMQPLTDKPLTLLEALSNAGGIDPSHADPTHIYVIRGPYQKPDVFWLNAKTPQALIMAQQFPLQENDIVYVSAASLNSVNAFFNQILPSFSIYYTIKGLS